MLPLTYEVSIPNEGGTVIKATISAFCSICGETRGTPKFKNKKGFHVWTNPCGHTDTTGGLMLEIECQCVRESCVIMASDALYPYCGYECVTQAGTEAREDLEAALARWSTANNLITHLESMGLLDTHIMDNEQHG